MLIVGETLARARFAKTPLVANAIFRRVYFTERSLRVSRHVPFETLFFLFALTTYVRFSTLVAKTNDVCNDRVYRRNILRSVYTLRSKRRSANATADNDAKSIISRKIFYVVIIFK